MDIQDMSDENQNKRVLERVLYEAFCDGIKLQEIPNENKNMKMEYLEKHYDVFRVEEMLEYTQREADALDKKIGDYYIKFYYEWLQKNDPIEYDILVDIFEENQSQIMSLQELFNFTTDPSNNPLPLEELLDINFDITKYKDEREDLKKIALKKGIEVYYNEENKKLWGQDQEKMQELLQKFKTFMDDVNLFQEFIKNHKNNSQMAIEEVDAGSKERVVRTRMSSR